MSAGRVTRIPPHVDMETAGGDRFYFADHWKYRVHGVAQITRERKASSYGRRGQVFCDVAVKFGSLVVARNLSENPHRKRMVNHAANDDISCKIRHLLSLILELISTEEFVQIFFHQINMDIEEETYDQYSL